MSGTAKRSGLTLADLDGWVWLPCGCTVCYQRRLTPLHVSVRCPQSQEFQDRRIELVFADLDPDRPPRTTFQDQVAARIARADLWYAEMEHYGPDPLVDPEGAERWAQTACRRLPRYGYTPGGRPIYTTTDPDYGRTVCVCGFRWADEHPPGDGTGCPEHLRPRQNKDTPADQLYRRRYAEQLASWRRARFRLVS